MILVTSRDLIIFVRRLSLKALQISFAIIIRVAISSAFRALLERGTEFVSKISQFSRSRIRRADLVSAAQRTSESTFIADLATLFASQVSFAIMIIRTCPLTSFARIIAAVAHFATDSFVSSRFVANINSWLKPLLALVASRCCFSFVSQEAVVVFLTVAVIITITLASSAFITICTF